jgi:hypothetical protein
VAHKAAGGFEESLAAIAGQSLLGAVVLPSPGVSICVRKTGGSRRAHLANVSVTAALASKIDAADGTDDVLVAFDLVDQVSFLVLKVFVAAGAVFVFGGAALVFLHLLDGVEAARAVRKSAEHLLGCSWDRHC